jgi:hypothetical protein
MILSMRRRTLSHHLTPRVGRHTDVDAPAAWRRGWIAQAINIARKQRLKEKQ